MINSKTYYNLIIYSCSYRKGVTVSVLFHLKCYRPVFTWFKSQLLVLYCLLSSYLTAYAYKLRRSVFFFFFSGDLFSANLTSYDLKTWLSGETVTIDDAVNLPTDIPTGTYEVIIYTSVIFFSVWKSHDMFIIFIGHYLILVAWYYFNNDSDALIMSSLSYNYLV